MKARQRLLRCYPPGWRQRYGDDLAAYLDDTYPDRLPVAALASILGGALRERARAVRSTEAGSPPAARQRAGLLLVLAAWSAFVVAGSSFAKLSEHFDTSLPSHARATPDAAYSVVQLVSVGSAIAAALGLALTLPTLRRFLIGGGWFVVRRHVARATIATLLTAAVTTAVVFWAHQLNASQRNGGDVGYVALWLGWVGIGTLTVAAWAAAAVATGRRLTLSPRLLIVESVVAVTVTLGMTVMLVAACIWAAAAAPLTVQLVGTVVLMAVAAGVGTVGVVRIVSAAFDADAVNA